MTNTTNQPNRHFNSYKEELVEKVSVGVLHGHGEMLDES